MLISGVQKITLLDFPDHTSCIVFTAGCNYRCGYCHNPEFVLPEKLLEMKENFIPEEVFFHFLEQRIGKLDGVVVSGGEPTMMPDLVPFLKKIKHMGFLVKLDTNGNSPAVLEKIFQENCVDYVAMDVKTSLREYKKLVGERADESKLAQSIEMIKKYASDYEFRSTLIQEVHTPEIIDAMAELFQGAKKLYLQQFRPGHVLNPLFESFHPFSESEMKDIAHKFSLSVKEVEIRI